jgi:hypothetical protein
MTVEEKKRMDRIFDAIYRERERQEQLKVAGKFRFTCADIELGDIVAGLILGEECGEVCRAVLNLDRFTTDANRKDLRSELIQVAAVAVAWVEKLDKRSDVVEGIQL